MGREHFAATFAETDRDVSLALAAGAEDDLVAVLEEAPGLAGGQLHRLLAASGDLAVTTQGETLVMKLFDRNGPSGWYSQAWMSRADQSLSRQKPAMCSAARETGMASPRALPWPIQMPSSSS